VWHELWWHFCEIYVKFQDLAGDAGRRPACYSAVPTSYILKKKTKQFYKKFFFVIYLHSDSLIDILTNAVIIWDVLIAIISRNILRKFLGWQSLIRLACRFKLQNEKCAKNYLPGFIRQQIRDRIFGNFTYFSGRT
jgi:hypothetical protein